MERSDIIIITNGAGELSAWVRPTVLKLAETSPNSRIILVIIPCQFATGRELEIAKQIKGIHHIITPKEYLKWLFLHMTPQKIKFSDKGIVVSMGGDLIHGKFLSKRLKYPAIAYTEKHLFYKKAYTKFMVPDEKVYNKLINKTDKLIVTGDLMVDGVRSKLTGISKEEVLSKWNLPTDKKILSFLPGSRTWQIRLTLPYYIETAKKVRDQFPDMQTTLVLSPYLTMKKVKRTLRWHIPNIKLIEKDNFYFLSSNDTTIPIINSDQHDFIANSTLAVTVPGTNTAEIAVIGTPMLSFFPFNRIDLFPVEGIIGWFFNAPIIGFYLKVIYGKMLASRTKFFALPNRKTGKEIVPEMKGLLTTKEVANKTISLLKDNNKLEQMKSDLKTAMGSFGAAKKVAEIITGSIGNI